MTVSTDDTGLTGGDQDSAARSGAFQVHLDVFEGPFDLLLALISKHKLDITEVALSQVTDEFIAYISQRSDGWDLDQVSYFLVVAATLLDLKAARLLRELGRASFRRLTANAAGSYEVVASFLALLELYREDAVSFEQVAPLGELYVTWTGPSDTDSVN